MVLSAPALISSSVATPDERNMIDHFSDSLNVRNVANQRHEDYYEGEFWTRSLGFSVPPAMQSIRTVAGWPGTVVDTLEERLDWLGWTIDGEDPYGLGSVYAENALDVDSGMAHLDALMFGVSFVTVGRGESDEPDVLVTVQSPKSITGEWDGRKRRLSAAMAVTASDQAAPTRVTLYLPDETVIYGYQHGVWLVEDRDRHKLGRVPVVLLANRRRGSRQTGRSEISSAVEYYTDAAMRTLLGMEVHREFYQAPQRWALNVDPDSFQNPDGTVASPWQSVMGRIWAAPPNEDGSKPEVGQFTPASPTPYIDMVEALAKQLAAEAGIPPVYLGVETPNSGSTGDSIRAGETRLVKRAERRQSSFSRAWGEVAALSLLVRDAAVPDLSSLSMQWLDPATPTRSAAADEAAKLVGSGVLPADSIVTYNRIGLTPAEQRILQTDKRRARASANILALTGGGSAVTV